MTLEDSVANISESELTLHPAPPGVRYLASIKGVGHPSSNSVEEPLTDRLAGSRLHQALVSTSQRMEMVSLRPWDGSREQLLNLVASAVRCSDAILEQDEPASPTEPTLLGWTARFEITVTDPRLTPGLLRSLLAWAGLINALEDRHAAYGRFAVVELVESTSLAG